MADDHGAEEIPSDLLLVDALGSLVAVRLQGFRDGSEGYEKAADQYWCEDLYIELRHG